MTSSSSVSLMELVRYLDEYLRITEIPDSPGALNGLQVENGGSVTKLAVAVDACQASIDAARPATADLLVVHHGLFWDGVQPVTGRHARRLRALLEGGVALYSAHLPLDAHPDVGNNAVLGRQLGLSDPQPFGDYDGTLIGVIGTLETERGTLVDQLARSLHCEPHLLPGGPQAVRRVAIITGAAGSMIGAARDAGADTFITGEGSHHTFFDAEEWGINVIYAGHYATETVGVKALGEHLADRFGIPWQFLDHPTGL